MNPAATPHPASYRDPAGFVFTHNGLWYRQVNQSFAQTYREFMQSGLYEQLTAAKLLLPHEEIPQNLTGSAQWYLTVLPHQLSFISYPYEWCFDALKDAALLTLHIAQAAIEKGFCLKDA